MYDFCKQYTGTKTTTTTKEFCFFFKKNLCFEFLVMKGASIEAAIKLNQEAADIVINWSGGLHHARYIIIVIVFWNY